MENVVSEEWQRQRERAWRLRTRVLRLFARKAHAAFRAWRERRREAWRRSVASSELRYLSDRMLRDIGLQRTDLHRMR
jgi:hypothetical protein